MIMAEDVLDRADRFMLLRQPKHVLLVVGAEDGAVETNQDQNAPRANSGGGKLDQQYPSPEQAAKQNHDSQGGLRG